MRDQKELLRLIRTFAEGIAVADLKDAYPTVMEDLQVFGIPNLHLSIIVMYGTRLRVCNSP